MVGWVATWFAMQRTPTYSGYKILTVSIIWQRRRTFDTVKDPNRFVTKTNWKMTASYRITTVRFCSKNSQFCWRIGWHSSYNKISTLGCSVSQKQDYQKSGMDCQTDQRQLKFKSVLYFVGVLTRTTTNSPFIKTSSQNWTMLFFIMKI
jgi:hypothetical protein